LIVRRGPAGCGRGYGSSRRSTSPGQTRRAGSFGRARGVDRARGSPALGRGASVGAGCGDHPVRRPPATGQLTAMTARASALDTEIRPPVPGSSPAVWEAPEASCQYPFGSEGRAWLEWDAVERGEGGLGSIFARGWPLGGWGSPRHRRVRTQEPVRWTGLAARWVHPWYAGGCGGEVVGVRSCGPDDRPDRLGPQEARPYETSPLPLPDRSTLPPQGVHSAPAAAGIVLKRVS